MGRKGCLHTSCSHSSAASGPVEELMKFKWSRIRRSESQGRWEGGGAGVDTPLQPPFPLTHSSRLCSGTADPDKIKPNRAGISISKCDNLQSPLTSILSRPGLMSSQQLERYDPLLLLEGPPFPSYMPYLSSLLLFFWFNPFYFSWFEQDTATKREKGKSLLPKLLCSQLSKC